MKLFLVLIAMLLVTECQGGLFSWLFKGKTKDEQQQQQHVSSPHTEVTYEQTEVMQEVALSAKIPFEIKSSDEKFLKEATELGAIKSSELDMCHHKVILGLHKSCAEVNEEDLAKVAVNLLNCQSSVENRPVFPCTSDMSLSDCTKDMDSNTWNAYHIVSNRARAVCYASRQEQFGAKTQMAVNVLMQSAEEQIKYMNSLQDGQEALGKVTSDTLESLSHGHEHLKKQQQQLSTAHQHVHNYISLNLRELSREKKLIASGQRELAIITEAIKKKIEEAKNQLSSQEDNQRASHKLILQDLSKIQEDALSIWQKLDASTQNILKAHEETVEQYGKLTDDIQRMNATVHHLMDLLHHTKQGVEDQLSWIASLVGGTDNTVQKVYSCVLHACYFFVGMVSASFLQVPYMTRVALVVLVPINAISEVKHDTSLQFSTLTTVLALCIVVNFVISCIWSIYRRPKKPIAALNDTCHQPFFNSSSPAVDLSPIYKSSVCSINSASKAACSTGDLSSDEESSQISPPSASVVRKRIFGGINIKDESGSETEEHVVSKDDLEIENEDVDSPMKTLASVRRHLVDHLNTYRRKPMHLDNLLYDRDTLNSRETSLNQSTHSSRSMTPRKLCASVCKNGQLCRNTVMGEKLYCHRHDGGSRESTPFSRRGSRRNTPVPS